MLKKDYNVESQRDNIVLTKNIIDLYVDAKMSLEQIAIQEKLTIHTVRQILLDNGVKIRQKNSK